jgi:hypothetical protein
MQTGYLTVELIIALVVGALLILSLNNIVVSQGYLAQRGRDQSTANAFAEQKFEALRSQGYLSLTNGTTSLTNELPSELKRPRSASLVISSQSAALKKVHLTVTYSEQGKTRTHAYITYIGELGVGQF